MPADFSCANLLGSNWLLAGASGFFMCQLAYVKLGKATTTIVFNPLMIFQQFQDPKASCLFTIVWQVFEHQFLLQFRKSICGFLFNVGKSMLGSISTVGHQTINAGASMCTSISLGRKAITISTCSGYMVGNYDENNFYIFCMAATQTGYHLWV